MEALRSPGGKTIRAVLDFRSPGPGSTRHLARRSLAGGASGYRPFLTSHRPRAMDAPSQKTKSIEGSTGVGDVVTGMGVPPQDNSRARLFSGASTDFGGEPNALVSLVDAAMPG